MTDLTKALLAHKLRNLITNRFIRVTNFIMGVVLILFGIRILFLQGKIFSGETENSSLFSIQKSLSEGHTFNGKKTGMYQKLFGDSTFQFMER